MITNAAIKTFKKYLGDLDAFARSGQANEKLLISEQDWREIDQLLLRISISKKGQGSSEYISETDRLLNTSCEDQKAIQALKLMV